MFEIGDLVRTKDAVGILDGDGRGPGHHVHYDVVQLNPDGGVVVQRGDGTHLVWERGQLESANLGQYMQELIAEAKFHLGWDVNKINSVLQTLTVDNWINLNVLDRLRDRIHDAVQGALDVKYEEIAEGLFNERQCGDFYPVDKLDFSPESFLESTPHTEQEALNWASLLGSFDKVSERVIIGVDPGSPEGSKTVFVNREGAKFISAHDTAEEAQAALQALVAERTKEAEEIEEIPLSKLAELTGRKLQHLNVLIGRGHLPEGGKVGRTRFMPKKQCLEILSQEKDAYGHWPKQEVTAPAITWDSLL